MFFDILTLFPEMFEGPFNESILARAQTEDLIEINVIDIRDYTYDKHNVADDYPYGGGAGMVLKVEPIYRAVNEIKKKRKGDFPVILLTPQGKKLNQVKVKEYSNYEGIVLICGHYEGVDERVRKYIATEEISIGDFVLTGGEIPAMALVDAVSRMIPSVLGDENSKKNDSFYNGLLDYPQYTRPREFKGMKTPDILLSGNHQKIERWRNKQSLKRTLKRRPDLIENKNLNSRQKKLLKEIKLEGEINEQN
ncbi:MAG: tRNA (guanosine(37)-N1)-methyltransferase TrmD [Bacillota bacterium]